MWTAVVYAELGFPTASSYSMDIFRGSKQVMPCYPDFFMSH